MNDRRRKTKSHSLTTLEGARVSLANVRGKFIDADARMFLNEKKHPNNIFLWSPGKNTSN